MEHTSREIEKSRADGGVARHKNSRRSGIWRRLGGSLGWIGDRDIRRHREHLVRFFRVLARYGDSEAPQIARDRWRARQLRRVVVSRSVEL